MACSCTVPVRTQLRRPSVLGRRAPRAAPAPRRGAQAAAAPPPPLDPHTLPRRALLAAAFATLAAPPRAVGSPFDDLLAAKRRTNAKFLTGPIILSRLRLKDSEALPAAEARQAVNKAALDCLTIESGNLQAYSNYREVCTFGIVARSVTQGPAARHEEGSASREETVTSVKSVVESFRALDASLAAGGADAAPRYAALYAALDRFQAAVLSALNVTPEQIA